MTKNKNLLYVVVLLSITSIIGIFIMNKHVANLRKEYSTDIRSEKNIKAKVTKIVPWHSVTNVELSNSKKYWIRESRNYIYDNPFIGDNINIGDSIVKKSNSDSLLIKSSKGEFFFVVGEWINKSDE